MLVEVEAEPARVSRSAPGHGVVAANSHPPIWMPKTKPSQKQKLDSAALGKIAELFRVFSEATRLAILQELRESPHSVNELVENAFIPNIENPEVKALFETGLGIFKAHESHAEMMVMEVK